MRRTLVLSLSLILVNVASARSRLVGHGQPFAVDLPDRIYSIEAMPDGSIFFTGTRAGVLHRDGTVEMVGASISGAMIIGPVGAVWWTAKANDGVDVIRRIGLDRHVDEFRIRYGAGVGALTFGPDANLWFTEMFADRIGRLSPTGELAEIALPPSFERPTGAAFEDDGSLLFATRRAVGRMVTGSVFDRYDGAAMFGGHYPDTNFTAAARTSDGGMWLAIPSDTPHGGFGGRGGSVVRMTPGGEFSEASYLNSFHSPRGLTAGHDDSVWFATWNEGVPIQLDTDLMRIFKNGKTVTYAMPSYPAGQTAQFAGMTIDRDGAVWVAVNGLFGGSRIERYLTE